MLPASATRPDALIIPLFDATWPLLMPIETLVPLGQQVPLLDAIWTFQEPSNVAADAGAASESPARNKLAITVLLKFFMTTFPSF